jgi:hypothetical protein
MRRRRDGPAFAFSAASVLRSNVLGSLRHLADGGHLPRVDVIPAVPDGSIAAARRLEPL